MIIYLATVNPDGNETHMIWEGATSIEGAKSELALMREMAYQYGDKPLDAYVYEAEAVAKGFNAEKLDIAQLLTFVQKPAQSGFGDVNHLTNTLRTVI